MYDKRMLSFVRSHQSVLYSGCILFFFFLVYFILYLVFWVYDPRTRDFCLDLAIFGAGEEEIPENNRILIGGRGCWVGFLGWLSEDNNTVLKRPEKYQFRTWERPCFFVFNCRINWRRKKNMLAIETKLAKWYQGGLKIYRGRKSYKLY